MRDETGNVVGSVVANVVARAHGSGAAGDLSQISWPDPVGVCSKRIAWPGRIAQQESPRACAVCVDVTIASMPDTPDEVSP